MALATPMAVGRVEVRYLGFHLGHGQVRPQINKTAAVCDLPEAQDQKEVRQFLGLAGYYRRFVPNYSDLTSPLTDLTKKEAPDPVQWTELCQQAFTQVKAALCGRPLLHSPDFSLPFLLQTDASDRGLGAVLAQEIEGEERPVLYISRKLSKRETMYSTIEKEVSGNPVGRSHPPLLSPGTGVPLSVRTTRPCSGSTHEGYQRADHPLVSGPPAL